MRILKDEGLSAVPPRQSTPSERSIVINGEAACHVLTLEALSAAPPASLEALSAAPPASLEASQPQPRLGSQVCLWDCGQGDVY